MHPCWPAPSDKRSFQTSRFEMSNGFTEPLPTWRSSWSAGARCGVTSNG
jgi:hypothetical protein